MNKPTVSPLLSLPLFLSVLAVLATGAPGRAQVPDGWAVVSLFRDANIPTLPGGLLMLHPSRPGVSRPVVGLGFDLTGIAAQVQINGASSVLVRSSDGALVVGEHVSSFPTTVDIHLLRLSGDRVVQDQRFPIGLVTNPVGYGWIDQMAWLPDGRVAFTQRGQFFTSNVSGIGGILDPATGRLSPLPASTAGDPNALAVSRDGSTLYVGIISTAPVSRIFELPLQGGTPRLSPGLQGTLLQLAVDNDGGLLAGFTGAPSDLVRIDPTSWTATPIAGITDVNALCVDEVSGRYLAYGLMNRVGILAEIDGNNVVPLQNFGPSDAVPSGIDLAPSMVTYGTASRSQNRYEWRLTPNPGGAPELGNRGFGLTVDASPGTAIGALIIGTAPTALPLLPNFTLWVDPLGLGGMFYLPPAPSSTLAIPVPTDPSLAGLRLFAQSLHQEAGGPIGSEGLRFTVF